MTAIQMTDKANNTFFGLTTASALAKAQEERDYWRKVLMETNDQIERFQQENKQLEKNLEAIQVKNEALKQELKECKLWVEQLQKSNKEQAELIGKQQHAISKALDEAAEIAKLRNEQTIKFAQYKQAVKIAADNFILEISN